MSNVILLSYLSFSQTTVLLSWMLSQLYSPWLLCFSVFSMQIKQFSLGASYYSKRLSSGRSFIASGTQSLACQSRKTTLNILPNYNRSTFLNTSKRLVILRQHGLLHSRRSLFVLGLADQLILATQLSHELKGSMPSSSHTWDVQHLTFSKLRKQSILLSKTSLPSFKHIKQSNRFRLPLSF